MSHIKNAMGTPIHHGALGLRLQSLIRSIQLEVRREIRLAQSLRPVSVGQDVSRQGRDGLDACFPDAALARALLGSHRACPHQLIPPHPLSVPRAGIGEGAAFNAVRPHDRAANR